MKIIIILALLVNVAFSLGCKQIECFKRADDGICYKPVLDASNNVVSVQLAGCELGQICVDMTESTWWDSTTTKTCTADITYRNSSPQSKETGRVEYDYCTTAAQCASGVCTNNSCVGKDEGAACTSTTQCTSDTYCPNGDATVCTTRIAVGETCTNSSCVRGAGCNANNVCTKLFSIESGESNQGSDNFCKSMFSHEGVCEDYTYAACNTDSDTTCTITTSISKVSMTYGTCNCNPDGTNIGICSPISSTDSLFTDYRNRLIKNMEDFVCHQQNIASCLNIPKADYVALDRIHMRSTGFDVDKFACLVQGSGMIKFSLVVMTILAILI
jgi:hypothetical protein